MELGLLWPGRASFICKGPESKCLENLIAAALPWTSHIKTVMCRNANKWTGFIRLYLWELKFEFNVIFICLKIVFCSCLPSYGMKTLCKKAYLNYIKIILFATMVVWMKLAPKGSRKWHYWEVWSCWRQCVTVETGFEVSYVQARPVGQDVEFSAPSSAPYLPEHWLPCFLPWSSS